MPSRKLEDACSILREAVPQVIAKYNARYGEFRVAAIGDVLRTAEEQQALYAQGRTTPGKRVTNADGITDLSSHQQQTFHDELAAHAIDILIFTAAPRRYVTEEQSYWPLIGLAAAFGLCSGGDWLKPDLPHLYCPYAKA